MNTLPPITVSTRDLARLEALLESPAVRQLPAAQALGDELVRANVVEPADMPAGVVGMNSLVTCLDENTGETHRLTLVYPPQADADQGKVSVLAPVGSALLGLSVGQHIDWPMPGGRTLRLMVTAVQEQPEAAG
ncbi:MULTISPECIES: nucleoside diphosphate kinase regulator [unclassified Arenimonas]|uniref:nucleoside diphosphate kinase regulator n=1 Tax=unclassified Arenimonas TaxID=2641713 RepID=UPI00086E6939|nr:MULTISPECIES: nucleoside diphosphate kinase regulator [unclassified Arenimonas]ODS61729.1 MAG: nucleoside diphosphate kinase regulator [Arenimonas sp. SCN 70-307]